MDFERLRSIRNVNALVFGDLMVDQYIMGEVKRISPEAPVPILEVVSRQSKLGGACNVIHNIIALGAKTRIIGCVGDDDSGRWLSDELNKLGVDSSFLKQDCRIKTITKTRLVSKNHQFLRYDEEEIRPLPEDYRLNLAAHMDDVLRDIHVVIISDYAKGAVDCETAQLLISNARKRNIPVVVDPKGKNYEKYRGATVCTPNTNELSVVAGCSIHTEEDVELLGSKLCHDIDLDYLALTRSEKGISLFKNDVRHKEDFPAIIKDVIDVTGAGDTVVSVIALLLAISTDLESCCKLANMAASVVCSKFGTATLSLNELLGCILDSGEFKYVDLNTAKYIAASLREKGKKIVFTNGCFDLLHAGHLSSFLQAKKYGDVLFVAVNSDASVKRIKGDLRPIISEEDRINMICALECVDYVLLMDDSTPENIIRTIQPDVSVKGRDWENKFVPEKSVLESYGGKIVFIDLEQGLSTTNIIGRIQKSVLQDEK